MFKYLEQNRPIFKNHVNELIKSISEHNLLHCNPILVDKNYNIIDGQHRLEAAKNIKTSIYYIVEEGISIKDVQRLNVNSLRWTLIDFVNSYVTLAANGDKRYEDYMELKEFSVEKGLSISVSAMLLLGSIGKLELGAFQKTREGSFEIKDRKNSEIVTGIISKISPFLGPRVYGHREMVMTIVRLNKIYKSEIVIKEIKSSGKMIQKQFNVQNYLNQISENTNGKLKIEV